MLEYLHWVLQMSYVGMFSIKVLKTLITRTCKSKKNCNCATVQSQIYDGTIVQSQISNIVFYSKSLLFLSLRCLFCSPAIHNNPNSSFSHLSLAHSGGYFLAWAYVRHGLGDGVGRGYGGVSWVVGLVTWM